MLRDLSALTPPILMAAAFLIATGAFVRHEMRAGRKRTNAPADTESEPDFVSEGEGNSADQQSGPRSFPDKPDDGSED